MAFMRASRNGENGVENGADVNSKGRYYKTALINDFIILKIFEKKFFFYFSKFE